jgi:hypothetical protein
MLPQQPCLRSGTWYAVNPAGHEDAVGARHDYEWRWSVMNEITSSSCFLK